MKKLINKLNIIYLKIKIKFFSNYSNIYCFNKLLDLEGFDIGKGTIFYNPNKITIDRQRPWMLKIGEYCKITGGVVILTHDYSRSVHRRVFGEIVGEAGITNIGNNVFIGINSIILMGTSIGDNVIVGAGSVVSGNIPNNVVVAGNPAKIICSIEDHYKKRKEKYIREAMIYAVEFFKRYGRKPKINEMNAFFPLFLERSLEALNINKINVNLNGDNKEEIIDYFLKTKPIFRNYNDFLSEAFKEIK